MIVDDVADPDDRVDRLWKELEPLMADDERRRKMSEACKQVARPNAAAEIAARLIEMAKSETRLDFATCTRPENRSIRIEMVRIERSSVQKTQDLASLSSPRMKGRERL